MTYGAPAADAAPVRVPAARRYALRNVAVHGERATRQELVALADDVLGCEARVDLLDTQEQLAPLDPPPCPVTLAWSAHDGSCHSM